MKKKMDELNMGNHIEIDRSEAEKYEFIHESCVFFITLFQPYITNLILSTLLAFDYDFSWIKVPIQGLQLVVFLV